MLRLPSFEHHRPNGLGEALALLRDLNATGESVRLIAGGTDLVPNMKHEIETPQHVLSLGAVGLRGITREPGALRLGAMTTLHTLAEDPEVRESLPALADAAAHIAGPQLRRMGTLGGNLCLDTRCLYINQSHFWRSALGFCLKKDGTACHVVAGGKNCVAAASNDSALPLLLYGAEVTLARAEGERVLGLDAFYVADGIKNTVIAPDEILTEVRVPLPAPGVRVAFEKLRTRASIDFPLLNLAVLVERSADETVQRCEVVVSALGARPKRLTLDKHVQGQRLTRESIEKVAKKAHAACRPLTNLATEPNWRRAMIQVLVRRAMARL